MSLGALGMRGGGLRKAPWILLSVHAKSSGCDCVSYDNETSTRKGGSLPLGLVIFEEQTPQMKFACGFAVESLFAARP